MKFNTRYVIVVLLLLLVLTTSCWVYYFLKYKDITNTANSNLSYCPPYSQEHSSLSPKDITLRATLTRMDNIYWSFSLGQNTGSITTSVPGGSFYNYQKNGNFALGDCVELKYNEYTSQVYSLKLLSKSK